MDEVSFLHTIIQAASEPLANFIRRKPAAQELIKAAWAQIGAKRTRKIALGAWDAWGKAYEALPKGERYPLTDAIMNQELPPGYLWVDEEKQEVVEGKRLPAPLQYGIVYVAKGPTALAELGESPAFFRISPRVSRTYYRRPGAPKFRTSYDISFFRKDGRPFHPKTVRSDAEDLVEFAKVYGDGSKLPSEKASGPVSAKSLFGWGAPYRKAIKAVLVAGAPGIRWSTRGGRGTVAGTSYFSGEGGTPAQRKVAAELLQEMFNQGSERNLSADDFTFYDEMTNARRGTDSATIPERFLGVATAAAPTRAQQADAAKAKGPEVRADRDSGYPIKYADIPDGAIIVRETKSRYGNSINVYRRLAGANRMPAVARVAKQRATIYSTPDGSTKVQSIEVPGFTRARIFGTAKVPVQAWPLVTKLLTDAGFSPGPDLRVVLEMNRGYSDVSHLRGQEAKKAVQTVSASETMDDAAISTFLASTKVGDRIDLVIRRPKGGRAEIRGAKITGISKGYGRGGVEIPHGWLDVETLRGAARRIDVSRREVYTSDYRKTIGRIVSVTPAGKKTRAKKASTSRSTKASVQVTGEGEFRYAKRSKDWLNLGITVDGKNLRFGWSTKDKRWARKLSPPAWAVETAIAEHPEEATEWQEALAALGRKSNPRSAAQRDREWNQLSLAIEREWKAGKLRANPDRHVKPSKHHPHVQSVLFAKARWTPSSARKWLARNRYEADAYRVDIGDGEFIRVRQADPDSFGRLRTITLSDRLGIKAIVGYGNKRRKNGPRDDISRADYPGLFSDTDQDTIPDPDDPNPYRAGDEHSIEEVRLSDEIGALIDVRQDYVATKDELLSRLKKLGGAKAKVKGRVKSPYSIVNKLRRKRLSTLTDVAGTKLIAPDLPTLRKVQRAIRAGKVGAVQEEIDYYENPVAGYRAVHFIVELDGVPAEIQLKTRRSAAIAKAGHTAYKRGTQDVITLDRLSALAAKADQGDKRAAREIDTLLRDPNALARALTRR